MNLLKRIKDVVLPCGARLDDVMNCHSDACQQLRDMVAENGKDVFKKVREYVSVNTTH